MIFSRYLALTLSVSLLTVSAYAAEIEVKGNYRISSDLIKSQVPNKQTLTDMDLDYLVKALFSTNQFENVSVSKKGTKTIIDVTERRVAASLRFAGNERLASKKLKELVRLKVGDPFGQSDLDTIQTTVTEAYRKLGRQDAVVSVEAQSIADMRSNIVVTIAEGSKTGVSSVRFVGNEAVSSSQLKSVMSTKQKGLFSWLLNNDVYLPEALEKDKEGIKDFYASKGYPDAQILLSDINRGFKGYDIELFLDEGEKVTIASVTLQSSSATFGATEAATVLEGVEGNPFDPALLESAQLALEDAAIDRGMISPVVSYRTDRREGGEIHVSFIIDEGPRTYVERINIVGNTTTRDLVIRREFDFAEGDLLTKANLRKARKRLINLNIFESVNFSTSAGSAEDRVSLTVEVIEKKTGEFSLGGGYSQIDGPIANGSISQANLFGTGRKAEIAASIGSDTNQFSLNYTEPYLFGNRITAETSLFTRSWDVTNGGADAYEEVIKGGKVSLEAPVSDKVFASVIYRLEQREAGDISEDLKGTGTASDPDIISSEASLKSSLGYQLSYNTLDRNIDPNKGKRLTFAQEFAGLGGDVSFIRSEVTANHFQELLPSKNLVGRLGMKAGQVTGLGDQELSFFDHFSGRDAAIRGFERNGFGPQDNFSGYHLGGTYFFTATAEAKMPLPLIPEEYGLKGVVFSDAGSVWKPDSSAVKKSGSVVIGDAAKLRASIGAGIQWDSPFGLIKADFAVPVLEQDGDNKQIFSFSGGTRF